jgi:predicted O-methyltransferase YrrM
MNFHEFGSQRLNELLAEERTPGGGHPAYPGLNNVSGLIDLIQYAKPRSVLEIGSCTGVSTEIFLLHCAKVVAVDSWEGKWSKAHDQFMARVGAYPHLGIMRGRSPEILADLPDGSFDLVYIDGAHDHSSVCADIDGSKRLAKHWMAGHDYVHMDGVIQAVSDNFGIPKVFSDTSWLISV